MRGETNLSYSARQEDRHAIKALSSLCSLAFRYIDTFSLYIDIIMAAKKKKSKCKNINEDTSAAPNISVKGEDLIHVSPSRVSYTSLFDSLDIFFYASSMMYTHYALQNRYGISILGYDLISLDVAVV